MGHNVNIDERRRTINGPPIHQITRPEIIEGRPGMPLFLNDDQVFVKDESELGGEFYILVAAPRETNHDEHHDHTSNHSAQAVATALAQQSNLHIRPFAEATAHQYEIHIDPERSHHYLDTEVSDYLRFRPNLEHLHALYGDNIDFFMVSCRLENRREEIFGSEFRLVTGPDDQPVRNPTTGTLNNINTRKFDLIQSFADNSASIMHHGGFAIFDRQDPDGTPDYLYGINMSDIHLARRHDEFERALLVRREGEDLYLKLNNSNANLDAAIDWINAEYAAGRVDWVMMTGDLVEFDGNSHRNQGAQNLADSNQAYIADVIHRLQPPVIAGLGNHEYLAKAFPAAVTPGNHNLTFSEAMELENERYPQGDIAGWINFVRDALFSSVNSEEALIAHYDTINPFRDFTLDLGRGDPDDPNSLPTRFVYGDMGGADYSHDRPDDPLYRDIQAWFWEWDWKHFQTITHFIGQGSPDVRGPTPQQNAWLHRQISQRGTNTHLFMHPPLLNSSSDVNGFEPNGPIRPAQSAGEFEDLQFNTMAHYENFFAAIIDSPVLRTIWGGHTHRELGFNGENHGGDYMIWRNQDNQTRIFQGDSRRLLGQLNDNTASPTQERHTTQHYYHPREGCIDSCARGVATLFNHNVDNIHNLKYTIQMGSTGVGERVFSRVTLNPDGLFSDEDTFHINKSLEPDQRDNNLYRIRYRVEESYRPHDRLIHEWQQIREGNSRATLERSQALQRIDDRTRRVQEAAFVRHQDSRTNDYPTFNRPLTHAYRSAWKWYQHFETRVAGSLDHDGDWAFPGDSWEINTRYYLNQHQMPPPIRDLFIAGFELGYGQDAPRPGLLGGQHRLHLGVVTPSLFNWSVFNYLNLQAFGFTLGPEFLFPGEGDVDIRFRADVEWWNLRFQFHGNVLHPTKEPPVSGYCGLGMYQRDFFHDNQTMYQTHCGLTW
jgi:hypothetical protein